MDSKTIEQIGTTGVVVLGLFYIIKQIVTWMQSRLDNREAQLDERSSQLVELTAQTVLLTQQTVEYITDSKRVNTELIAAIGKMSSEICLRLMAIEGQHLTPKGE